MPFTWLFLGVGLGALQAWFRILDGRVDASSFGGTAAQQPGPQTGNAFREAPNAIVPCCCAVVFHRLRCGRVPGMRPPGVDKTQ